jgi:hypothetical protein
MAALIQLRDKVIRPLVAAASKTAPTHPPRITTVLDLRYRAIEREMRSLFITLGMAP